MIKFNRKENPAVLVFLGLVFVISTLIKLFYIWGDNYAFTPDQGRDLIDIRQMVVTHIPRLVGPTTSINGVLLGPFYYYFITIPFILFKGNPTGIVIWQIIWFQLSAIFIWYVLRKKNLILANCTTILLLLSPVGFSTARYFWNANVMPIFTIIFFACLLDTLWFKSNSRLLVLGLVAGISLQIEAAFGLLFFPFGFLIMLTRKFLPRDLFKYFFAFCLTLLPQIFFEFRHGFLMTKTLVAGLSGASFDLGERLSFGIKIMERKNMFLSAMRESSHISFEVLGLILLICSLLAIYYLIENKKSKPCNDLVFISLSFLFLSAVFYLIFPQHVKSWYVLGLPVPIILMLSGVLSILNNESWFGVVLCWLVLLLGTYHTVLAHSRYLYQYALLPSTDPSNMGNEIRAVDIVYRMANGRPFNVYSYLPSIYDYTYQYLFWWYGTGKYGYQPTDIAYLPGQPEYIKNNQIFWSQKKMMNESNLTFLIIQNDFDNPSRLDKWRTNYESLCLFKTIVISNKLLIEELTSCAK